jgi:hypothetical protein
MLETAEVAQIMYTYASKCKKDKIKLKKEKEKQGKKEFTHRKMY